MLADRSLLVALALAAVAAVPGRALADEAAIRRAITERLPDLPRIDAVAKSPVAGLFEVRYNGTELLYASENGDYIFVGGSLVDTRTRSNLTEVRARPFIVSDFDRLPLQDAIVIRQGDGSRRMAMFVDPNCEYCTNFEHDLASMRDVTVYAFLIPILGPESRVRARDIWCAADPARAWREWMLARVAPIRAMKCDPAALDRNIAFAAQQQLSVTPSLFFADGSRKRGVLTAELLEARLHAAAPAPTALR